MKSINRTKRTEATKQQLDNIRNAIYQNDKVLKTWICGPDFVAIELSFDKFKTQGVAVTHWRDKHNPKLGKTIALGRAVLRLSLLLYNVLGYYKSLEILKPKKNSFVTTKEINEKTQQFFPKTEQIFPK